MTLRKLDALIYEHFCQFPNAERYIRFVIKPAVPHLYTLIVL